MTYQFNYRDIANALYRSLNQEPFYLELERNVSNDPVACQEAMLRYFDYSMEESRKYGELFIPEGGIPGASVWSKPTGDVLSKQILREKKTFMRQNLGETSLRKYDAIVGFMSEKAREIVPDGCWYLSIVGIAPEFQNQGLGGGLVKPVLEKTDALGVPSYLETFNPRNKKFYERLGYQEVASFVEPVTDSEYWIMVREPLSGAL